MMSGKKLIFILIGFLFSQSLFSQYPGEVLLIEESPSSKYFVEFIVNGNGNHSSMTTILTINGYAYSKTTPTNYQLVSFYTDRIDNGFQFAVYNDGGYSSTFLFTKEDIQNRVNQKWTSNFHIHQLVVHSKTALTDFAPLIVCTNEVESLNPIFESEFAFDRISGILTIDGFSHTYSRANPNNVSFLTSFLSGVSYGESHAVSFTNEHFSFNSTSSLNDFYLLEPPPIDIFLQSPKCHGESGTVTIENIPINEFSNSIRLNIIQLYEDRSGDMIADLTESYRHDGKDLYYGAGSTQIITIPPGETRYVFKPGDIDNEEGKHLNLRSGWYMARAFYLNGGAGQLCSFDTDPKYMEEPAPISILTTYVPQYVTDEEVFHTGSSGGSGGVHIVASGGSEATYKYKIDNGEYINFNNPVSPNSRTVGGLFSGNIITVSNSDNCPADVKTVSFNEPDPLEISINEAGTHTFAPSCSPPDNIEGNGSYNNGKITFTTDGGVGNNQYKLEEKGVNDTWTEVPDANAVEEDAPGEETVLSFSGIKNGIYRVKVTDQAGISENSETVSFIRTPIPVGLETNSVILDCHGGNTTIPFENFDDSYSYELNGIPVNSTIIGEELLAANTHTIKVAKDGCYKILDVTISEPDVALEISEIETTPATCNDNDGRVDFSIYGGWEDDYPYFVQLLSNGNPIPGRFKTIVEDEDEVTHLEGLFFDNLKAGTYELKAYSGYTSPNNYKCEATYTLIISSNNPLDNLSLTNSFKQSCAEVEDGQLTINNSDRINGHYTFNLKKENSVLPIQNDGNLIAGLDAGNYSVTITETTGRQCSVTMTEDVEILSTTLTLRIDNDTNPPVLPYCSTASNGEVTLIGDGGRAPYQYRHGTNGDFINTSTFTGLNSAANHIFYIKDSAGCENNIPYSNKVDVDTNPISFSALQKDKATCFNKNDGSLEISSLAYAHADFETLNVSYKLNSNAEYEDFESYQSIPSEPIVINSLLPGNYSVKIEDNFNCELIVNSIEIADKGYLPVIEDNDFDIDVACEGKETARYEFNLSHTNTEYNGDFMALLLGENEQANSDGNSYYFDELGIDIKTIRIEDDFGCFIDTEIKPRYVEPALTLTEDWIPAPCENGFGRIEVSAAGGFSPNDYTFYFNSKELLDVPNGTFDDLPPGTIGQIRVVDSAGCEVLGEADRGVEVRDNPVSFGVPIVTHPTCIDAEDGKITFELIGVVGKQYNFILTKGDDSDFEISRDIDLGLNTIDDLFEGLYHLVVYEDDGTCNFEYEGIELIDPEIISISGFNHNKIQYFDEATGEIAVTIENGSKNYNVALTNLDEQKIVYSDVVLEGIFTHGHLIAGNYKLSISDVNNCLYFSGVQWYEIPFEIKQPEAPLEIELTEVTHVSCFDYENGRITAEATGGWDALYEYSLEGIVSYDWQTTPVFENLLAGSYVVKVRDEEGAIVTTTVEITQPDLFEIDLTHINDATCPNYHNGELEVLATNGVYEGNGLTYFIKNLLSEDEVVSQSSGANWRYNHLPKGEYELIVTDQNGCFDGDTFAIGEPDTVQITIDKNYIRIKHENTGVININAINGNGYYDYQWAVSGNDTPIETGSKSGDLTFDSLIAGEYIFMLKDTANCYYEGDSEWMVRNIIMEEPEFELSFTETETPVTCNGLSDGQTQLTGVGGWGEYEFSFDGAPFSAETTYEGLAVGFYNVVVKDSVDVIYERVVEITQPDILTVSESANLGHVLCYNGSDGSIEIEINGGNPVYFVSIDEENWQEGNVASGLPIGTYTVYVKDTKGCENSTGTFTLFQPTEIYVSSYSVEKSTCQMNKGSIDASFGGGTGTLSYGWQREFVNNEGVIEVVDLPELTTPSIEHLFAGQYIATVIDSHECISQFDFFVNDNTDLTITAIDTYPVTCYGYSDGAAKVHAEFGNLPYNYSWVGDRLEVLADSAWNFSAGNYVVAIRDGEGCYVSQSFEIGTPDILSYTVDNRLDPLCLGGEKGLLQLSGLGGTMPYEYSWDNGTVGGTLSNIDPGNYGITITDAHDCISWFSFDFDFQRVVEPFIGNDTIICHYNSLILDGGDYATFSWQSSEGFTSGSRTAEINEAATYYLVVTDMDNCIGFDTIDVAVSTLEISGLELEHVSCAGFADGNAIISIHADEENYSISWPNGSFGFSSSGYSGGEYRVSIVNEFGCNDFRMFTIHEPLSLSLRSTFREPLCNGVEDGYIRPVASGGTEPYDYIWTHGVSSRQINNLPEGEYVLNVMDANDCLISEIFELPYVRTLLPDLGSNRAICQGNHLFLTPGHFSSYKWYLNEEEISAESIFRATQPGDYTVVVTDDDDCLASDEVSIALVASDILPSFLMATSVPLGDTLLVVDVTNPKPDYVSWLVEGDYQIVETNDYYSKIIFKQEGMFNVTLSAVSPTGCIAEERKSVLVTAPGVVDENGARDIYYSNMKSLAVSPNPSSGNFTANVKLHESADVNFYLVRIDTGQIYETRKRNGLKEYSESFTHSGAGLFVLFAESGGERLMEKVLVY